MPLLLRKFLFMLLFLQESLFMLLLLWEFLFIALLLQESLFMLLLLCEFLFISLLLQESLFMLLLLWEFLFISLLLQKSLFMLLSLWEFLFISLLLQEFLFIPATIVMGVSIFITIGLIHTQQFKASFSFHKITLKNTQMTTLYTNLSLYITLIAIYYIRQENIWPVLSIMKTYIGIFS